MEGVGGTPVDEYKDEDEDQHIINSNFRTPKSAVASGGEGGGVRVVRRGEGGGVYRPPGD